MAHFRGPDIPRDGLILALDAGSTRSNPNTGTTWHDLSGNGHDFSVPSGSNVGSLIQFSNNQSGGRTLANTNINEMTIDTWFYAPSGGTYTGCCDTLFGTYWFRTFIIGQAVYSMIGFMNGSGTYTSYQHPYTNVSYGEWHHTVTQRRGNEYNLWIDGNKYYSSTYGSGEFLYGLGGNWVFAENNRHSDLRIGAARVWNRGLSDAEVSQLYNNQKARFGR